MNQHLHKYHTNVISPRKRNNEKRKHLKLCFDNVLNEQYLHRVECSLKWNHKSLVLNAVWSVCWTRWCQSQSAAKCDIPFLNEAKASAFWQGTITFLGFVFSIPFQHQLLQLMFFFCRVFSQRNTIYHIIKIANFSWRSVKPQNWLKHKSWVVHRLSGLVKTQALQTRVI